MARPTALQCPEAAVLPLLPVLGWAQANDPSCATSTKNSFGNNPSLAPTGVLGRKLDAVCQPGQFIDQAKTDAAEKRCGDCTAGKWTHETDSTQCLACAPGKYWVSASEPCMQCPSGFKGDGLNKDCVECPSGKSTGDATAQYHCYDFCQISKSGVYLAQAPCVPKPQNCTDENVCEFGREYWNNSEKVSKEHWKCEPCSKVGGVDCFIESDCDSAISVPPSLKQLAPLPGYFRVPWIQFSKTDNGETWKYKEPRPVESPIFLRCPFAESCTPFGCVNSTSGPLCALCDENYFRANRIDAHCTPCALGTLTVGGRVGILFGVMFVVLLFLGYLRRRIRKIPKRGLDAARKQWRTTVGIISICVSYFQVGSSLPDVINYVEWNTSYLSFLDVWSFVNVDLVDLLGLECLGHNLWNIHAKIIVSVCALACVALATYAMLKYQISRLWQNERGGDPSIELLKDAAAAHLYETVDIDQDGYVNTKEFKFLLRLIHFDILSKNKTEAAHGGPHRKKSTVNTHHQASGTPKNTHMLHGVDALTPAQIHGMMKHMGAVETELGRHKAELLISKQTLIAKLEDPLVMQEFGGDDWIVHGEAHRLRVGHLSVLLTICFSLVHAPVSRLFLGYVQCQDIGGKFFIRTDLHILCQGDAWGAFAFFCSLLIVVYTFALPAVITYQLCRHRKDLHTPAIQRQYGFLYKRFHIGAEFWGVIEVVRKLTLMGVVSFFGEVVHRILACTLVSIVALALILRLMPHRAKVVLQLDTVHFSLLVYKYIVIFYAFADDRVTPEVFSSLILIADIVFLMFMLKFVLSVLFCVTRAVQLHRVESRARAKARRKVAPGEKGDVAGEQKSGTIMVGNAQKHANGALVGPGISEKELHPDSVEATSNPSQTEPTPDQIPSAEDQQNAQASERQDKVTLVRNWGSSSDDEAEAGSVDVASANGSLGETEDGSENIEASADNEGELDETEGESGDMEPSSDNEGGMDEAEADIAASAYSESVMARALADYVGQYESCIPLTKGQLVRILGKDEQGWTHVETNGISGQVPTSYLEITPQ